MNAARAKQSGGILNMCLSGEEKKSRALQKFLPIGHVISSVYRSIISWLEQRIISNTIGAIDKSQILKGLILKP